MADEEIVELKPEDKETDLIKTARRSAAKAAVRSIMDDLGGALNGYETVKEEIKKETPWAVNLDPDRHLLDTLKGILGRNLYALETDTLEFGRQHGDPTQELVLNTNPTADNYQDTQVDLTKLKGTLLKKAA